MGQELRKTRQAMQPNQQPTRVFPELSAGSAVRQFVEEMRTNWSWVTAAHSSSPPASWWLQEYLPQLLCPPEPLRKPTSPLQLLRIRPPYRLRTDEKYSMRTPRTGTRMLVMRTPPRLSTTEALYTYKNGSEETSRSKSIDAHHNFLLGCRLSYRCR